MRLSIWSERVLRGVIRGALLLFPRSFRSSYGEDLEEAILDRVRDCGAGRWGKTRLIGKELGSLLKALPATRASARPTVVVQRKRTELLGSWIRDLKAAARSLSRARFLSGIALLTLAIGIGSAGAVTNLAHKVLLAPLPFPDPDRLIMIWSTDLERDVQRWQVTTADFLDWRERSRTVADMTPFRPADFNLMTDTRPERVAGYRVGVDFFRVLGVAPALGRGFLPEDGSPNSSRVAVLGHALWRNHFGADPEILGQTIRLDDLPHTVVGVLPPNTAFPERDTDLWVPLRLNEAGADRISRAMSVVGRMAPGVTLSQTQAEMDALAKALAEEYPESNAATGAWVAPLQRELVRGSSRQILILAGAVAILLLVTCANLMGLLLIRWTDRKADLAVRTAVGASRASHLRLLLSETLLLGVAGGIGGLLVGATLTRITSRFIPPALSLEGATGISPWLVGITFGLSLLAAVLFGLGPAIGFSRASPAELLRQRRGGPTVLTRRTQGVLVIGEVALALALVVGSSLLLQSLRRLSSQELGFRPEGVLVARVEPPSARYSEAGALTGFYRDVLARVSTLPGVLDAGFVSYAPLAGGGGMIYYEPPGVEEREGPPDLVYIRLATTDLLDALGASLASGRSFEAGDQLGAPPVAVVNQAFASRYLGGRPSALGAELPLGGLDLSAQVVGLLEDIRYLGIDEEPWPEVWLHEAQIPTYTFFAPRDLVVRTAVDPLSLSGALRAEIEAVDPSLPLFNVRTLESVAGADLAGPRFQLSLFTGFAVVSLFLACLGVFAVVQYSVQTRRREIGLRVALGASAGRVVRGVVGHGMTLVLSGVGIGVLCTLLLGRVMESLLYETSLRDPFAFLFTCVLVVGAGCAACFVPSRRATRLSPMTVLRDD